MTKNRKLIKELRSASEKEYNGLVKCPACGEERNLRTTEPKLLIDPPRCFKCFMSNKQISKEIPNDK